MMVFYFDIDYTLLMDDDGRDEAPMMPDTMLHANVELSPAATPDAFSLLIQVSAAFAAASRECRRLPLRSRA